MNPLREPHRDGPHSDRVTKGPFTRCHREDRVGAFQQIRLRLRLDLAR